MSPFPGDCHPRNVRIWLETGTAQLRFLNDDSVNKQAEAGARSLPRLNVYGDHTARTEDLRNFMHAHAHDKEA